ncbi:MAG TPA: hypothetical protein VK983_01795 [Candidatus Limnocylindrales bacterium]|nr:hypothetical protein [Candidatus Limnocylindrales bacterium]
MDNPLRRLPFIGKHTEDEMSEHEEDRVELMTTVELFQSILRNATKRKAPETIEIQEPEPLQDRLKHEGDA